MFLIYCCAQAAVLACCVGIAVIQAPVGGTGHHATNICDATTIRYVSAMVIILRVPILLLTRYDHSGCLGPCGTSHGASCGTPNRNPMMPWDVP